MRQILTQIIAQMIIQQGISLTCKAPDAICGDLPDKIAKRPVGYRPVEYLLLNPEERATQTIKRQLKLDPEYQAAEQEIKELKTTTTTHSLHEEQQQKLTQLRATQALASVVQNSEVQRLKQEINANAVSQAPATYLNKLKELQTQQQEETITSRLQNTDPTYKANEQEIKRLREQLKAEMLYAQQKRTLAGLKKFQDTGIVPTETRSIDVNIRIHDPRNPEPARPAHHQASSVVEEVETESSN